MIKEDIKQITDIKELQRLYIELNNEIEKQEKEVERLNNIINDLNYYIKQRTEENIIDELRIELKNIELISKGIIKVVKGE